MLTSFFPHRSAEALKKFHEPVSDTYLKKLSNVRVARLVRVADKQARKKAEFHQNRMPCCGVLRLSKLKFVWLLSLYLSLGTSGKRIDHLEKP